MKVLALILTLVAGVVRAQTNTNTVVVTGPLLKSYYTNPPVVITTFPGAEPCPVCHGPVDIQLVRLESYELWKQATTVNGQNRLNVVYQGTPTNWLQTNIVSRWPRPSPPPLPNATPR